MNGLGVYPGEPCYDPNRSGLLPFWLDTWNESYCEFERNWLGMDSRMNLRDPEPGYSPAVPDSALETPYFITDEDVIEAQRARAEQWRQTAIPATGSEIPAGVLVLGAVVAAFAFWPSKRRRR